jgi:hypothetical protein
VREGNIWGIVCLRFGQCEMLSANDLCNIKTSVSFYGKRFHASETEIELGRSLCVEFITFALTMHRNKNTNTHSHKLQKSWEKDDN